MKPGLEPGHAAQFSITVTPEMAARLGDRVIHPLYGTAAMVAHLEEAARMVLEPFLEADEEAVGYTLNLKHAAPTPIGAAVRIQARLVSVQDDTVVCAVEASNAAGVAGLGTFTQVVVSKDRLTKRISEAADQLVASPIAAKEL
jgi:predicted thioesterase